MRRCCFDPIAYADRFLFRTCDPRLIPWIRIGFALLVLVQVVVVWGDAEYWFSDEGVLSNASARRIAGDHRWSVLFALPSLGLTARIGLALLFGHAVLMLLGIASRFQSAAIFIWLVSFQNRNPLINDGEDTVFRLMAFLLIWLPLDCGWSLGKREKGQRSDPSVPSESAWGLRLIQMEMTAIYASTALCKSEGITWWDGSAVWWVSKMADDYGRLIPPTFFDIPWASRFATWGTLAVEFSLPFALWIRPLRNYAVIAGLALHLGIEASMNLFLFQWVMMLGLLAFIDFERFPFKRSLPRITHDASPVGTHHVQTP
jgi:hypothetical protein